MEQEDKCQCCGEVSNIDKEKMMVAITPGWGMKEFNGKRFMLCNHCLNAAPWLINNMLKRHGLNPLPNADN